MTTSTGPTTALDLSGFLIAHAGMRQEFGLLARAAAQPLDPERAKYRAAIVARIGEETLAQRALLEWYARHGTGEFE